MATHNTKNYVIWQWNCRGYARKRGHLQQYLINKEKPDVILLQETNVKAKLSGYRSFQDSAPRDKPAVATLVKRNLTVTQHEIKVNATPHLPVETAPPKNRDNSPFTLNVYSSPRPKHRFRALLKKAAGIAGTRALLVAGDFNAHHSAWGYKYENLKGKNLWEDALLEGLTLITDPSAPTRQGNSVCADTSPDLAFVKNITNVCWTNTQEDLGSDHTIVEIRANAGPCKKKSKLLKLVEWDKFRQNRENRIDSSENIEDIEKWTSMLRQDVAAATHEVPPEANLQVLDSKLLHMWEAKRSLQARWKVQRHNRTLRRRIAKLNRDIEEYALQLCKSQWEETCNSMDSRVGFTKAWNLLRFLLDPEETKTAYRQNVNKIINVYKGTHAELLHELRMRYTNPTRPVLHSEYKGTANECLDRPFSIAEVRAVLHRLNTKSSPGPDGVTNKTLRNLDDTSIEHLTVFLNECWEKGRIPRQWKTARIVMIPKPGKRIQLENLRPISLTSCVGKVMEHVVLARLTNFLEDHDLIPHTMLGFRKSLSTQDAMLQLKHQVIDSMTTSTKAILGLDLKKAFDNVKHSTILTRIIELGLGKRTYDYVRDFLTDRTARITLGELESGEIEMGSAGTPQGSVISPLLFNLALIGLPAKLEEIDGLSHSLYADDITLWVTRGCDGQIEQTLQRAIDTVQRFLEDTGLTCSAEKSELLVYRPTRRGRKPKYSEQSANHAEEAIQLTTSEGHVIPKVDVIRVLGLYIAANGHNGETVRRLEHAVNQTIRLLKRITNRHSGMKEGNTIRLVQAFVLSRITYVASYLNWHVAEKIKLDCLIRKVYKQALCLPMNTSTVKLLELGLHNTLDELIEAHNVAQYERLSKTKTGRYILEKLGIHYHTQQGEKADITVMVREKIVIPPLPKNMHPEHHTGRRNQRAQDLQRKFGNCKEAVFVDAARYARRCGYVAAVVDGKGTCMTSVTVQTPLTETAEEVAIALAVATTEAEVVISDSQAAIRNYANGRVSREALRILMTNEDKIREKNDTFVIWTPAHTQTPLAGNEAAHAAARALTNRAVANADAASDEVPRGGEWEWGDRMTSYHEITQHYKLERRKYPPPHNRLNKKQAVAWRQLQTYTYPNPVLFSLCYPDLYLTEKCKVCDERATLSHILWECSSLDESNDENHEEAVSDRRTRWEGALLSSSFEQQLWAVQRAEEAARAQGLVADA